jgi:hypothetical protein
MSNEQIYSSSDHTSLNQNAKAADDTSSRRSLSPECLRAASRVLEHLNGRSKRAIQGASGS